jgi:predicted nuclease of predicted toxin-antitoxin system
MRFLADMGISPKAVTFLRDLGHDAVHLHEEGLDRLSDPAILTKASEEHRILLTHDLDFAELVALSGSRMPSVVLFRLRNMRREMQIQYLTEVVKQHASSLAGGAFLSVTEGQIRIRTLPLGVEE